MATTSTRNARSLIKSALRKANILGQGDEPDSDSADEALEALNLMLKSWQNMGYNLWTKTGATLTLTTAASYDLDPVRPLRILSARLTRSGIETPMHEMTRDEYDCIPQKSSTGLPTAFHYDRQREAAKFHVWPVLAAAAGETISYTYEREIEDLAALDDVVDVPGEWWEAVVYNLADRLGDTFPTATPNLKVTARAASLLKEAGAFDREGSIFMGSGW
jgi:hypothetical protein